MTAVATEVAIAVAAVLNGESWTPALTAERLHVAPVELQELDDPQAFVVVASSETEPWTRGSELPVVGIDVGILQRVADTAAATLDPLIDLVDAVVARFNRKRLTGMTAAFCTTSRPDPLYDVERLNTRSTFLSVVRLDFRVYP